MSKILFLTGMPGSGKSYWAAQLSKVYGLPYYDLDSVIEEGEGRTISEIFDDIGEGGFRELEAETLNQVIQTRQRPFILSTGGGTPLRESNRHLMQAQGIIVYLKASVDRIVSRVQQEAGLRPLLAGSEDLSAKLTSLLQERSEIYEQADLTLQVEELELREFEPIIRQCIEQQ